MPDWGDPIRDKTSDQRAEALIAHAGKITCARWKNRSWTEVMQFVSRWVTDFATTHGTKMAIGALAGFGIGQTAGLVMAGGAKVADYLAGQTPELLRTLGDAAAQQAYATWSAAPGLPGFLKTIGDDYGPDLVETVQGHFADEFVNDSTQDTLEAMVEAGLDGPDKGTGVWAEVRQTLQNTWRRMRYGGVDYPGKVAAIVEAVAAAGKLHAQVKVALDQPDRLRYCDDVVALADGINQMIALRSDAMAQVFLLESFLGKVKAHFRSANYAPFKSDPFDRELTSLEQARLKLFAQEASLIRALDNKLKAVTREFLERADVQHKLHSRVNVYKAVQSCSKQHCFGPKGKSWFSR